MTCTFQANRTLREARYPKQEKKQKTSVATGAIADATTHGSVEIYSRRQNPFNSGPGSRFGSGSLWIRWVQTLRIARGDVREDRTFHDQHDRVTTPERA